MSHLITLAPVLGKRLITWPSAVTLLITLLASSHDATAASPPRRTAQQSVNSITSVITVTSMLAALAALAAFQHRCGFLEGGQLLTWPPSIPPRPSTMTPRGLPA